MCCVVVCDLETSRIGAPYIYNVRLLRVKCHDNPQNVTCLSHVFNRRIINTCDVKSITAIYLVCVYLL